MFRKLATAALLVPMAFNGLWMVCANEETVPSKTEASATEAATPAHCTTTICVREKGKLDGSGCFITTGDAKGSIAIFLFGVATLPCLLSVLPPSTASETIPEIAAFYSNPTLAGLTPPPKA